MIRYQTPDGARWVYGGDRPVGVTADLDAVFAVAVPDVGPIGWAQHSELWAGAVDGTILDLVAAAVVAALVDRFGTAPTAEQIADRVRALLTHPG